MNRMHSIPLAIGVLAAASLSCTDGLKLRATQVQRQDELIGGPSARGKVGDYLLENDRIRAVVGGPGPGFAAGIFGGTLLDLDLQRPEAEYRDKRGFDAFSESFPLANLLIVNPSNPRQVLRLTPKTGFTPDPKCADATFPEGAKYPDCNGLKLESTTGSVRIIRDGSDGQEATVRVEGHSAYIFDVLKFLNRDFIDGLLSPLSVAGMTLDACQLADLLPGILQEPDLSLFGLLNRLQIAFDFSTDYTLRPGEAFVRMTTTVAAAPGTEKILGGCPPVPCDLDCGEPGYAMEEVEVDPVKYGGCETAGSMPFTRMCPVCACAKATADMPTFNESRDFFKVLLGDLASWKDPAWKGGIVAGDFLFYGADAPPFAPGVGYDVDRKVYEDMWQGVGTLGSPMTFDYLAALGENVSYAWTTRNEAAKHVDAAGNEVYERRGHECPTYRLAVVRLRDLAREAELASFLKDRLGVVQADAKSRARQLVVDRKPVIIGELPMGAADPGAGATQAQRDAAFKAWVKSVLDGAEGAAVRQVLGDAVDLDLLPAHACMSSKVLVPLFSSSATAVLTHFTDGDRLAAQGGGGMRDEQRQFRFSRFLAVGDGDVGSVLREVYALRGTAHGEIQGAVLEEGSLAPIRHADVFLLKDPRPLDDQERPVGAVPADFAAYRVMAQDRWGHSGVWSQMQTNRGTDKNRDGAYSGPIEPDRYFAVARTRDRGLSALVPVVVEAGQTVTVNLLLPAPGKVEYRITDQGGEPGPGRLTILRLDASGNRREWTGGNEPELGDPRYDNGVSWVEHSSTGHGTIALPPGRYDVIASRGLEFGLHEVKGLEVLPGQRTPLSILLNREVDTTGYVAADFHVHAQPSSDAGLPLPLRVQAALAEGLEFVAATDHDVVVDYQPFINAQGVEAFLKTEPGVEASPLEYGHYNGYPVRYDDTAGDIHNAPVWQGKTLRGIWDEIRSRAAVKPEEFVLQVNHPRDGVMGFFNQVGMKGYSLQRKTPGMQMCSQAVEEAPCDFDAMELMNGKNLQYLHTPTVGEIERHNRCYKELIRAHTAADLEAACSWLRADPVPDCAAAKAVDLSTVPEAGKAEAALKRDHCLWTDELRTVFTGCTGDPLPCKRRALEGLKLYSLRWMMERTPQENDAYFATTAETDLGCSAEKTCEACLKPLRAECFQKTPEGASGFDASCVVSCRDLCSKDDARPCTDRMQPIEDWFKLLDRGFVVTGVGNSDSHNVLNEVGMARNYVASTTDRPDAIRASELHRAIKAHKTLTSSGPFVTFRIRDDSAGREAEMAGTLAATGTGDLKAHLRVQTPSWFQVDRIEIYRNSRLEQRVFLDAGNRAAVLDFDQDITLPRPTEDSWYVAIAYGLGTDSVMSPVYKRHPYGDLLIATLIALGADQLIADLGDVLERLKGFISLDSLVGSIELPDSYPILPFAVTNPIWVDLKGDGFTPREAVQAKDAGGQPLVGADGLPVWDLPPFCSKACDPKAPAPCPENQQCVADSVTGLAKCIAPTPASCVGLQSVGLEH